MHAHAHTHAHMRAHTHTHTLKTNASSDFFTRALMWKCEWSIFSRDVYLCLCVSACIYLSAIGGLKTQHLRDENSFMPGRESMETVLTAHVLLYVKYSVVLTSPSLHFLLNLCSFFLLLQRVILDMMKAALILFLAHVNRLSESSLVTQLFHPFACPTTLDPRYIYYSFLILENSLLTFVCTTVSVARPLFIYFAIADIIFVFTSLSSEIVTYLANGIWFRCLCLWYYCFAGGPAVKKCVGQCVCLLFHVSLRALFSSEACIAHLWSWWWCSKNPPHSHMGNANEIMNNTK